MLVGTTIRKAKPSDKQRKLIDGEGLYLLITVPSGKLWQMAYRYEGKQKTLSLGKYPYISLSEARTKAEEARKGLAKGIDPSATKRALKETKRGELANSFEIIAREWHNTHMTSKSEGHAKKVLRFLDKDVFPWLGKKSLASIEAPEILKVLRIIESRGANDLAHTVKRIIGQVFRYAIATGRANRNPVPDLQGALTPAIVSHHAAIIEPAKIGEILRASYGYTGGFVTQCALKLSFFVMLRPGEVRRAEWSEINLEDKEWRIPGEKMKMKDEHIIPLSSQAIEIQ